MGREIFREINGAPIVWVRRPWDVHACEGMAGAGGSVRLWTLCGRTPRKDDLALGSDIAVNCAACQRAARFPVRTIEGPGPAWLTLEMAELMKLVRAKPED